MQRRFWTDKEERMKTIFTQERQVTIMGEKIKLIYELLMSRFPQDEGDGNFFGIRIAQ